MMPAARRARKSHNNMFKKAKSPEKKVVYRGIGDKFRLYGSEK